jgi:integrase
MAKGQILARAHSRWLLRIYQGRHPASLGRSYKNTSVSGTREVAENELARQLALRPSRPSGASRFSDYIEWWLTVVVEPRLRAKTARDYRGHVARYALPTIGDVQLENLDRLDLQSLCSGLLARRLSSRTIRYTHSILHAALEQAKIWKLIPENPAAGLVLPRDDRREFETFTPEEARRFCTAASLDSDGLVFLVALATGLRPSEYLALRRCDFDRNRNTFTVERTIERVPLKEIHGGPSVPGRWKSDEIRRPLGRRTVSMPAEVASRVANLLDRQADLFDTNCGEAKAAEAEGLIFRTPRGKPIHERNLVQRVFKPLLRRAGLPDLRLYDLRHCFATFALRAGTPARLVSEQLGHASVALTLDTYGRVLERAQGEAAQDLSDLIFVQLPTVRQTALESERKPVTREAIEPNQKLA